MPLRAIAKRPNTEPQILDGATGAADGEAPTRRRQVTSREEFGCANTRWTCPRSCSDVNLLSDPNAELWHDGERAAVGEPIDQEIAVECEHDA